VEELLGLPVVQNFPPNAMGVNNAMTAGRWRSERKGWQFSESQGLISF